MMDYRVVFPIHCMSCPYVSTRLKKYRMPYVSANGEEALEVTSLDQHTVGLEHGKFSRTI